MGWPHNKGTPENPTVTPLTTKVNVGNAPLHTPDDRMTEAQFRAGRQAEAAKTVSPSTKAIRGENIRSPKFSSTAKWNGM